MTPPLQPLAVFIKDFNLQSKASIFSQYEKDDLVRYCKQLGVDACKSNTKDVLYKKIKGALSDNSQKGIKGG